MPLEDLKQLLWGNSPYFERQDEITWALGRLPSRTYVHKSFVLKIPGSQDYGQPARFVCKVFDEASIDSSSDADTTAVEWTEHVLRETPAKRKQIRVQIARQAGSVREIVIEEVPSDRNSGKLRTLLKLDRAASARLIDLVSALRNIPAVGDSSDAIDDGVLSEIFADPRAMQALYVRSPERFRALIRDDSTANDLIAITHRKAVVERFRELLEEPTAFADELRRLKADNKARGKEDVWQIFFEANPWILGVSLSEQLLTSWDERKLERTVAGHSVAGPGKRVDALLKTNGVIQNLVFAEIKHHETDLLAGSAYRPGVWGPSPELSGGITQIQQTVHAASNDIGARLAVVDGSGAETGEHGYLVRPRSILVAGTLSQLRGDSGGVIVHKQQSFELFRRNLYEPTIVTFDELLAKAAWHTQVAGSNTGE